MGDFNGGRDIFDGIGGATQGKASHFLSPGSYPELTIKSVISSVGKKDGKQRVIAEFTITAPPVYSVADKAILAGLRERGSDRGCWELEKGQEVTYMIDMSKPSALGNLNNLVCAIRSDIKPGDVTKALVYEIIGPNQPAAGVPVKAKAVAIKTGKGDDFTVVEFSPVL